MVVNPKLKVTSFDVILSDSSGSSSTSSNRQKQSNNNVDSSKNSSKNDDSKESNDVNIYSQYDVVRVGWVFNCKLKLPWNPILAAAGETTHYLDRNTGLIAIYEERWKSKPWDVVKRLFTPT